MSQTTCIPVPYFQFIVDANEFDIPSHTYKPVPNKKIHRHCPFIVIDADYINEPLMDVAIAVSTEDEEASNSQETLNTATLRADEKAKIGAQDSIEPNGNQSVSTQGSNTNSNTDSTNNLSLGLEASNNEMDAEAAAREKDRLDYLARQKADPRHNNVNSFKTLEMSASKEQTSNAPTANQDSSELELPDYEAVPELIPPSEKNNFTQDNLTQDKSTDSVHDSNSDRLNRHYDLETKPENEAKQNKTNDKVGTTDSNNTGSNSIDTKPEDKKSKKSADKEPLTEEEQLKQEKEAKLEAYKQFVAEQKSKVDIDYQGIRVSIEANALPSRMYFIMNALSAIIASYGLVINSAAVVIGAMLVAMMLGPISGVALAIIDNRTPFLRKSLLTVLAGGAMVIAIGFIVGFIHQETPLTNEILSRTQPTSMDLMVALAGGTAGAYAMISPHLSVAVVGVAVATALVPPLAASGILFAHGQGALGFGALLLAITNIVAIQFTNAMVLWFTGFRRLMEDDYKTSTYMAFFRRNVVPLVLLTGIGAYLTYNFNIITKRQGFETGVKETINDYFIDKGNALTATQFLNREEYQTVRAVIRGETRPASTDAQYLEQLVNKQIKADYPKYLPVRIQLRYMPVVVIESSPDHQDHIDETDAAILANE